MKLMTLCLLGASTLFPQGSTPRNPVFGSNKVSGGASLPASCIETQIYFLTSGSKGLYQCIGSSFVQLAGATALSSLITVNAIPIVTAPGTLGESSITESGGNVGIGTTAFVACGGVDDTAAIQAKLTAAGGHIMVGPSGGTCVLTAPLKIYSNTWLDLGTATVSSPTGAILLQNASVTTTVRSVSDAAITSGSTTLTSATAAFTSADVGRSIYVTGARSAAGEGATGKLCTTIVTVSNSTTVTVADAATQTASDAAATIYARDSNIKISGGVWTKVAGTYNLQLLRVDGLLIADTAINVTSPAASEYHLQLGDVTEATVRNVSFSGTGGPRVTGPAKNVALENIRGNTIDDLVSVAAADWPDYQVSVGNISNVSISTVRRGITATAVGSAVKLLGGTTELTLRNISVRDVVSEKAAAIIVASDAENGGQTDIGGLLIDGVVGPPAATAVQLGATLGRDVIVRNVFQPLLNGPDYTKTIYVGPYGYTYNVSWESLHIDGAVGGSTSGVGYSVVDLSSVTTITRAAISNIKASITGTAWGSVVTVDGTATDIKFVNLQEALNTETAGDSVLYLDGTLSRVSVDGLYVTYTAGGLGALINIYDAIDSLTINDFQATAATTIPAIKVIATTGEVASLLVTNSKLTSVNCLMLTEAASTVGYVLLSNVYLKTPGRMVNAYSALDITLTNVVVDSSINAMVYTDAAAVTIRGSGFVNIGGAAGLQRAATETVRVMNPDYTIDVQAIARGNGDAAYNTNAGSACGAGTVISDGSNYKSRYSGTVCD